MFVRILGIVLILVGVLGLMMGGIPYGERRQSAEIGPIEVHTSEKRTLPVPPIAAVAALVAGAAVLAAGMGRPAGRTAP